VFLETTQENIVVSLFISPWQSVKRNNTKQMKVENHKKPFYLFMSCYRKCKFRKRSHIYKIIFHMKDIDSHRQNEYLAFLCILARHNTAVRFSLSLKFLIF